jgi:hypothetical protein
MNGSEPKIEIFKPFGDAFELTKKILFQPFDLKKWCVIGFAAFLANLNVGGFTGFRFPGGGNWTNHVFPQRENIRSFLDQLGPVWWTLIGVGILLAVALFVVLLWVRARGHFVFIDSITHNRAAIVQPWNEYRVEGNSYFVFSLLATLALVVLIIGIALVVMVPALIMSGHHHSGLIFVPLLLILLILPLVFFFATVMQFVAPVMYRQRIHAWPAFLALFEVLGKHFVSFLLYFLFSIVLGIAIAIVAVTATCLTCCIAAIPYVGTVMLLPIYVFMQSFPLLFIRQFGPNYDVWQGTEPLSTVSNTPPPIQT